MIFKWGDNWQITMPAYSKICGLVKEQKRPLSITLDYNDISIILKQPDAYKYFNMLKNALSKNETNG